MKNKTIIILGFLLIGLVVVLFLWNNRVVSTITLDINPSIEIMFGKNEKVKKVVALNEDAKDIISNDLKGMTLEESLSTLANNIIDKGYADDGLVTVIMHSTGNIENRDAEMIMRQKFDDRQLQLDVIVVENITKEDKELAKKNNISPAKASYINSIVENNKNIDVNDLADKPVQELRETKNTGRYCDKGYTLDGDFCLKEIRREKAPDGLVCPNGYFDDNGICYEEVMFIELDNLVCRDDFIQDGKECLRTEIIDANPSKFSCPSGEEKTRAELGLTSPEAGDANDVVCVDLSNATHPVTPCELPANDPTERMSAGGKCYWHRAPVIEAGCPGKIQVDGMCWDDATNVLICAGYRDGKQYSSRNDICEHSIKYIDPVVTEYECPDGFKLDGNKCKREEKEEAMRERVCPSGYTKVEGDHCLNYNKTTNKVDGLVCDAPDTKLKGNECIYYEIVDAKNN